MKSRVVVAAIAGAVLSVGTASCNVTTNEDKFCGRLRSDYKLDRLVTAIDRRDQRRVTESLTSLRELQDVAPQEIHDDFRTLVDATSDAVRAITNAPGADGEQLPVDIDRLNSQLAEIADPAQRIASYADRSCGLKLNP